MQLPKNATIAVADGAKLHLYRNTGDEADPKLAALAEPAIGGDNKSAGVRHSSNSANPNDSRLEEDSFAAATAAWLNQEVLGHRIDDLVVIAAPKSLGELRKHYHKALQAKLLGELAKDLTGHSVADIEAALAKA
jgi:protein required for attachment to host cells